MGKKYFEPVSLVLLYVVSLMYTCTWLYKAFDEPSRPEGPSSFQPGGGPEGWQAGPHCPRGAAGALVETVPAALLHLPQVSTAPASVVVSQWRGHQPSLGGIQKPPALSPLLSTTVGKSWLLQQGTPPLCIVLLTFRPWNWGCCSWAVHGAVN